MVVLTKKYKVYMIKKRLLNYVLALFIVTVALIVLYLSWVSSPKIGQMRYMPTWVATWVDSYTFMAIRTAIPLVLLGILAGIYLHFWKRPIFWWAVAWILLSILIVLAELGQYFRPMRAFDWRDIAWGSAGAALGLGILYTSGLLWNLIKSKRN